MPRVIILEKWMIFCQCLRSSQTSNSDLEMPQLFLVTNTNGIRKAKRKLKDYEDVSLIYFHKSIINFASWAWSNLQCWNYWKDIDFHEALSYNVPKGYESSILWHSDTYFRFASCSSCLFRLVSPQIIVQFGVSLLHNRLMAKIQPFLFVNAVHVAWAISS